MDVPIIKIELEGLSKQISTALMTHGDEFDKMISEAIEKSFTVETIQHKIDMQVAKALDNAIDCLGSSLPVRQIMEDIVLTSLSKKRDEIEQEKT
jgi:phospholipid N-methyltransferase